MRNLKSMDVTGKADPYVVIKLMNNGKVHMRHRTQKFFNTLDAVFEESFPFQLPVDNSRLLGLEIKVKVGINSNIFYYSKDDWYDRIITRSCTSKQLLTQRAEKSTKNKATQSIPRLRCQTESRYVRTVPDGKCLCPDPPRRKVPMSRLSCVQNFSCVHRAFKTPYVQTFARSKSYMTRL